jgi:hypothetical protein
MKRERAKELLPIIQAYAEGKKLQYKVVGYNDWHDVDDEDGINEGTRYEYRIKPSEKYNEIFKLKSMLEENHIPFEWIEHNDLKNGYQICYPGKDGKRVCSVIEHSFSYGNEKDLLEIQGLLTAVEEECDSVLGNLTADNVFQRILSHWEKAKEKTKAYCPFKDYEELIAVWERKTGYMPPKDLMPVIWLKNKDDTISMITDFKQIKLENELLCSCVTLDGDNYNMQELLESYTFLDGSPCGVRNGEEESNT